MLDGRVGETGVRCSVIESYLRGRALTLARDKQPLNETNPIS
jgi:hypothetical protein